jgi:exportin-7
MVLSVFVRKIITNLKYWSHREPIVVKTLLLLNELCVGYSSVRKLVKLEEVQFILQNHTVRTEKYTIAIWQVSIILNHLNS